jgi:hypothetical protein
MIHDRSKELKKTGLGREIKIPNISMLVQIREVGGIRLCRLMTKRDGNAVLRQRLN